MKTRLLPFVFGALALLQPAPVLQAGTTLGDALDATNLIWDTGGTTNVGRVYEQDVSGGGASFDGIAAAKSGQVYDNGETWLQTTVVGPGTASFWWQAYSEPNKDWLEFNINATRQGRICGSGTLYSSAASGWREGGSPPGRNPEAAWPSAEPSAAWSASHPTRASAHRPTFAPGDFPGLHSGLPPVKQSGLAPIVENCAGGKVALRKLNIACEN